MSDQPIELTRRKALAALGTVGVASAGAGLGTTAYFSDREDFTGNSLTAGELDLKVDWEEHYSDWSSDEEEYASMAASADEADYVLPAPEDNPNAQDILLNVSDFDALWAETAVEAWPDPNNDGSQEVPEDFDICSTDADLDGILEDSRRTEGTVNGQTTVSGDPLINIQDLKPGDFGEVTLSYHLCGNDGYVWLTSSEITDVDGENTEPEIKDPDEEQGGEGEDPITEDSPGELAEQLQVRAWYDDGDNIYEEEAINTPTCVAFILDDSGSMQGAKADQTRLGANALVDQLNAADNDATDLFPHEATVVTFGTNETVETALTANVADIQDGISQVNGDAGQTNIEAAIDAANAQLSECPPEVRTVAVLLSNGAENVGDALGAANTAANVDTFYTIGVQAGTSGDALLQDIANVTPGGEFFDVTDVDDIRDAFEGVITALGSEEIFFEGTLEEFGAEALYDPGADNFGIPLDANPESDERDCFEGSTTNYVALEWWLPIDHGNEVQGDRVSFDLGFYTEQCRHNDGSGQAPESS